jgi:hypothetical protein
MSYLLSVDPGLRKCGAVLWHDGELLAARLLEERSDSEEVRDVVEAMVFEVVTWWTEVYFRDRYTVPFIPGDSLRLVCEYPRTYGGRSSRGDANDLISVALVAGAILGRLACPSRLMLPEDWKGGIPKPQTKAEYLRDGYPVEERTKAKLSPAELARVEWPRDWKKRLDVADALGIGLWALKR